MAGHLRPRRSPVRAVLMRHVCRERRLHGQRYGHKALAAGELQGTKRGLCMGEGSRGRQRLEAAPLGAVIVL